MREILFRAKRIDNGEWVVGSLLVSKTGKTYIRYYPAGDSKTSLQTAVDPNTVGQYTGLTDKTGRKIFEGDILQTEGYKFYVAFGKCGGVINSEYFGYQGYHLAPADRHTAAMVRCGLRDDIFYYSGSYGLEVIGNIHDNPELLEV